MDVKRFLEELYKLSYQIDEQTEKIELNKKDSMKTMPALFGEIKKILPDWFLFIEQTELGSKEELLWMLEDIQKGIENTDEVYLADALYNGLGSYAKEYMKVIEDALNGE